VKVVINNYTVYRVPFRRNQSTKSFNIVPRQLPKTTKLLLRCGQKMCGNASPSNAVASDLREEVPEHGPPLHVIKWEKVAI